MLPKESEIKYGVSTVTFIDQHIPILRGIKHFLLPGMIKKPNLNEFSEAVEICEKLEIGIEVAFRKWGEDEIKRRLTEKEIPVLNIHGSAWFDTAHTASQGLEEDNKTWIIADPLLSWVAFGFLKGEFEKSYNLAKDIGSPFLTLHPGGAKILHQKGKFPRRTDSQPVQILIEHDWKRTNRFARTFVWKLEEVVTTMGEIAESGLILGGAFDTSHYMTSYPPNEFDLCSAFEFFNQNCPGGVQVIHLAGAKPGPEGRMIGGLPLDPRIVPEDVIRHYQEFHQMLRGAQWDGAIVVELSSQVGRTSEERRKSVEITLNALETMPKERSISLPGKTTQRPL
jgi:hypothetical protein